MRQLELASFARFLLTGAANTALTGALLLVIATQVQIAIAYTIVYLIGLVFTTVLSASFVFRSNLTVGRAARFVAWYVCVYLLGVSVVRLSAGNWHASHLVTTLCALVVTAPLNFIGGSLIFRRARSVSPQQ
ncbi:MAG TPA: GtrA family protein [Solirubrobacteraceae bacterium]|nr:GtrA family protein [Solirubrobacteraceae bacterium]